MGWLWEGQSSKNNLEQPNGVRHYSHRDDRDYFTQQLRSFLGNWIYELSAQLNRQSFSQEYSLGESASHPTT